MTARIRAINDSLVNRQLTKPSRDVAATRRFKLLTTRGCAELSNQWGSLGTYPSDS
jgi:hypothetical protein